ncbi:portal protein [Desulfovibrio intestinalis]|nr:portal protein [Desulfovibrio intestinalis]
MTLKQAKQLVSHMEGLRNKRLPQWQELGRLLLPSRGLFKGEDSEGLRESRLFNNAGQRALGKAAAGMTQAITPASSPWFRHAFMQRADKEATGGNEYVDTVDATIRAILSAGGFYQAIHAFNRELMGFACALLYAEDSQKTIVRFGCQTCGTYCVAVDADRNLSCVTRRVTMTPTDMEKRFGKDKLCSATVSKLETKPYDPINVVHIVRARTERDSTKIDSRNMPFGSYWYEESGGEDFLQVGGFHEMPFFFTTWEEARGVYGTGPGDEALTDQRGIEGWEARKAVGVEKMIDPPMLAPGTLKQHVDRRPGAIIPAGMSGSSGWKALYEVNFGPAIAAVQAEINQIALRLDDIMKANIFANMSLETRPAGMTMTEYMDRRRRAAELMGPTVSAYEPRVLTPVIERVYGMIDRWGLLPLPPENLSQWASLQVSYMSPMAQMLEQSGAVAIQSLLELLLPVIKASPEIVDKLDCDQVVDELAQRLGVPASIIRSDEVVAAIRQQRAEAQAAQQQQQNMAQTAQIAAQLGNMRTQGTVAGEVLDVDAERKEQV